jgi:hypothetical protein
MTKPPPAIPCLPINHQHSNLQAANPSTHRHLPPATPEPELPSRYRQQSHQQLHSYTDWLIKNGILPTGQPLVRPAQDRIKIASGSETSVEVLKEEEKQAAVNLL